MHTLHLPICARLPLKMQVSTLIVSQWSMTPSRQPDASFPSRTGTLCTGTKMLARSTTRCRRPACAASSQSQKCQSAQNQQRPCCWRKGRATRASVFLTLSTSHRRCCARLLQRTTRLMRSELLTATVRLPAASTMPRRAH